MPDPSEATLCVSALPGATAARAFLLLSVAVACLLAGFPPASAGEIAGALARLSATQVAAGGDHTCAISAAGGGQVYCWGDNTWGQLGDGSTEDRERPVLVPLVEGNAHGAVELALGLDFTCALIDDGTVQCWGRNNYGQLGDGTTSDRHLPVVSDASSIAAIGAGGYHACALHVSGQILCWGNNTFGELGNGASGGFSTVSVTVIGIDAGAVAISAGYNHTCALRDGNALCWGRNADGQLGTGNNTDFPSPIRAQVDTRVAAVSAGAYHTCVLTTHGAVQCFGYGADGELGDGNDASSNTPVAVQGLGHGVRQIAGGSYHTCAIDRDDVQKCWGENQRGQLGNYGDGGIPLLVDGLPRASTGIAIGAEHTCATDRLGSISCWGHAVNGQLGIGHIGFESEVHPRSVIDFTALDAVSISAGGGNHVCVATAAGRVMCWGQNSFGAVGDGTLEDQASPHTITDLIASRVSYEAVGVGWNHSCALDGDGRVRCWGNNSLGQLGDGTTTDSPTATLVSGLPSGVVTLAGGGAHTCALLDTGEVMCWGANGTGQLGDGSGATSTTPVTVAGLVDATAIALGGSHSCALRAGGQVVCWGYNEYGQLGDGSVLNRLAPVAVVGITDAIAIAAGQGHTCALHGDGIVSCWGANEGGQLGDGSNETSLVPVTVVGLGVAATHIGLGQRHSCAALVSGQVKCWGRNDSGQLGDFSFDSSSVPVEVSNLASAVEIIAGGDQHTCALEDTGVIACWGRNADGQLGEGIATDDQVFAGHTTWRGQFIDFRAPTSTGPEASVLLSASASSGSLVEFDTWTGDAICTVSGNSLGVHAPFPIGLCGVRAATRTLGVDYWTAPQQRRLIRIGDAIFDDPFE